MKEHAVILGSEMVRAILEGRKTQTRRVIKPQPSEGDLVGFSFFSGDDAIEMRNYPLRQSRIVKCPYGQPGDRLWVKETWNLTAQGKPYYRAAYTSDAEKEMMHHRIAPWKSARFMPRIFSRITLEVVRIRVERVQEISTKDCVAEGMTWDGPCGLNVALEKYMDLWDKLNAKRGYGWEVNPWVWVIEFKLLEVKK
jgi:hypothetical protein